MDAELVDVSNYVIYKGVGGWYFRRVGTDQCQGPFDSSDRAQDRAAAYELTLIVMGAV